MGFTRSNADLKIIQKLSDYPNMEDGLSSEELKKKFDEGAETVQADLNKVIDELEEIYGAERIGVEPLDENDTSNNNVQAKLKQLRKEIQSITLGQIADGTITKAKLDTKYANSLAEKNGEIQTGLNAEMLNNETLDEIINNHKPYKIGFYEGNAESKDYSVQKIELGFTPQAVMIRQVYGSNVYDIVLFATKDYPQSVQYGGKIGVEIVENGFNVRNINTGTVDGWINYEGYIYNYIAYR